MEPVTTRVLPLRMKRDRWNDVQYSVAGISTRSAAGMRANEASAGDNPAMPPNQAPASGVSTRSASASELVAASNRVARATSRSCSPFAPASATATSW